TAGGATRRSIRMGGLRIGTDFGMQPYRVTTVMPTYFGEVAVPSSVDLYIDGVNRFSGSVPAGPFELDVAPGVSGSGHAQLVVTDALGRQQVVSVPFYAARGLLAPGLTDG